MELRGSVLPYSEHCSHDSLMKSANYLAFLPQLRERALRWIQSQGAVICYDPELREQAASYLWNIPQIFPELIEHRVVAIYIYDLCEQPTYLQDCSAVHWRDVVLDRKGILGALGIGTRLSIIGISTAALDAGQDYTVLVFLHELAHAIHGGGHDESFHNVLDGLIERYNAATGSRIINNYCGLQE